MPVIIEKQTVRSHFDTDAPWNIVRTPRRVAPLRSRTEAFPSVLAPKPLTIDGWCKRADWTRSIKLPNAVNVISIRPSQPEQRAGKDIA